MIAVAEKKPAITPYPALTLWLRAAFLLLTLLLTSACEYQYQSEFLLPQDTLKDRQLESRKFYTDDYELMVSAIAGVLQDTGFILDEAESELGLLTGAKMRDATDVGQMTMAIVIEVAAAFGGMRSGNAFDDLDKEEKVKISVIVQSSREEKGAMVVRATFQKMVWNNRGQISRMHTIEEPLLYQTFFNKLSKAVFLEAHNI